MAELVYGIPEHVDRIEGLVDLDRPSLCLVDFDEREEHIELVALLRTLRCAPAGLDRRERCAVILVCANGPDVHVVSLELRHLQCIDTIIFRVGAHELHEGDLPTKIECVDAALVVRPAAGRSVASSSTAGGSSRSPRP